jgi:hypothetical protein
VSGTLRLVDQTRQPELQTPNFEVQPLGFKLERAQLISRFIPSNAQSRFAPGRVRGGFFAFERTGRPACQQGLHRCHPCSPAFGCFGDGPGDAFPVSEPSVGYQSPDLADRRKAETANRGAPGGDRTRTAPEFQATARTSTRNPKIQRTQSGDQADARKDFILLSVGHSSASAFDKPL